MISTMVIVGLLWDCGMWSIILAMTCEGLAPREAISDVEGEHYLTWRLHGMKEEVQCSFIETMLQQWKTVQRNGASWYLLPESNPQVFRIFMWIKRCQILLVLQCRIDLDHPHSKYIGVFYKLDGCIKETCWCSKWFLKLLYGSLKDAGFSMLTFGM